MVDKKNSKKERAIFETLAYHAVFQFPLTPQELSHYLICRRPISKPVLDQAIRRLIASGSIRDQDGYLCLNQDSDNDSRFLLFDRQNKQLFTKRKLVIAQRAAAVLERVPWVKMVAVTGGLSMENVRQDDDIDLMVVTTTNRLWITRLVAVFLVSFLFKRRKPLRADTLRVAPHKDELCMNLWLDESALSIPKNKRSLYIVHELAQMKPLINIDTTYERMMQANRWGGKFLANAWREIKGQRLKAEGQRKEDAGQNPVGILKLFNLLNLLAFRLQLWYMRSKMTTERVALHSAFFHSGNRNRDVLMAYQKVLDTFGIDR